MIEEVFIKAFITRITNILIDIILPSKSKSKDQINLTINLDENAIKSLVTQKISEEINKLNSSHGEAQFLESVRYAFVKRIHDIFGLFEINQEDIPKILKFFNVTMADLLYEESLIKKFDDEIIKFLAESFEINKDWIYGRSVEMIPNEKQYGFYKNSNNFSETLLKTNPSKIYILTDTIPNKNKDEQKSNNTICLIIEYSKYLDNQIKIHTYKIYDESCKYGYWKCRYELKRVLLYIKKAHQLHLLEGIAIPNLMQNVRNFQEGKIKFDKMFQKSFRWHPEDYVYYPKESSCYIKDELEELEKIESEFDTIKYYS